MRIPVSVLLCAIIIFPAGRILAQFPTSEDEIGLVQVLESEAEAIAAIFPLADSAAPGYLSVDSLVVSSLRLRLGGSVRDTGYVYHEIFEGADRVGTAVVAEEQGKYRPITFVAGVDTELRIVDVRVLVYRESRGGEVRHTRFLKQYRGKSMGNPIRINRDIINITGATISVNALNAGVRKVLAIVEYLHTPPEKF